MFTPLLFLLSGVLPQPTVAITEDFISLRLSEQIQVLQTKQSINFQEALEAVNQHQFSTPPKALVFPGGPYYYWAHFNVKNQTSVNQTIFIEVRNAHLNHLELFEYSKNGDDYNSLGKTGDYLNFDSRPINYRFFAFKTTLIPGEMRSFLLHTDKFNESIKFPVVVHNNTGFFTTLSKESTMLGGYFGVYALIILLLLIVTLSKPTLLNISLIFYVLGFSLFAYSNSGIGFQYWWPDTSIFNSLSRSIFAAITSVSLMFFAYAILDLNSKKYTVSARFHRAFTFYLTLNSLLFIGYYFLVWEQSPLLKHINVLILQIPFVAQLLYLIFISFYLAITKQNKKYLVFPLAIIGVILASLSFLFEQIGMPIVGFAQEQIMLAAIVFDFLILAILVGVEFYQIRNRNSSLTDSLNKAIAEGAINFLEGQHIERSRLAQQIHDGASVKLSALQMQLSVLATQDKEQQQTLIKRVNTIAEDIRNYTHNLSPIILQKYGFIDAIEEVTDSLNVEQKALKITFQHHQIEHHQITGNKNTVERELYFICLELINNALKHSNGSEIKVEFSTNATTWCLQVADNGSGYNPMELKNSGIGLPGIHWRLQLLNGKMSTYYKNATQIHQIKIPYVSAAKI